METYDKNDLSDLVLEIGKEFYYYLFMFIYMCVVTESKEIDDILADIYDELYEDLFENGNNLLNKYFD